MVMFQLLHASIVCTDEKVMRYIYCRIKSGLRVDYEKLKTKQVKKQLMAGVQKATTKHD